MQIMNSPCSCNNSKNIKIKKFRAQKKLERERERERENKCKTDHTKKREQKDFMISLFTAKSADYQ
jgi:hypothetical protein